MVQPKVNENNWQRLGMIISVFVAVTAVVAAHFHGIDASKTYTNEQILRIEHKIDVMYEKISNIQSDIAAIKAVTDDV